MNEAVITNFFKYKNVRTLDAAREDTHDTTEPALSPTRKKQRDDIDNDIRVLYFYPFQFDGISHFHCMALHDHHMDSPFDDIFCPQTFYLDICRWSLFELACIFHRFRKVAHRIGFEHKMDLKMESYGLLTNIIIVYEVKKPVTKYLNEDK